MVSYDVASTIHQSLHHGAAHPGASDVGGQPHGGRVSRALVLNNPLPRARPRGTPTPGSYTRSLISSTYLHLFVDYAGWRQSISDKDG